MKQGECPAIFHFFEGDGGSGRRRGGMWEDSGIPVIPRGDMMGMRDGGLLSGLRAHLQPPKLPGIEILFMLFSNLL